MRVSLHAERSLAGKIKSYWYQRIMLLLDIYVSSMPPHRSTVPYQE